MQLGLVLLLAAMTLFLIFVKFVADILEHIEAGRDKPHVPVREHLQ
jgi:hypothetical protein